MPITSVFSDAEALTLTVVGDYPVPLRRLWEAWCDPRQLERFWGPVEWPATFLQHDMRPDGEAHYYMTGPDGTQAHGWWRFLRVEPMRLVEVEDGFSKEDGTKDDGLPYMRMVFTFEETPTGSRYTCLTSFPSLEAMEQLVAMGMMEGMRSAMGQMDAVLADLASFAASVPTQAQILDDTRVRISRVIRGTVEQVWRAHHDATLLQRWLLGPDGWTMPVCEVSAEVGASYRYGWEAVDGSQSFGFEGEVLESVPPYRSVTTERMTGMDGPATTNELTLTAVPDGTLMTLVITYPSAEVRDAILGTGMTDGMERSYRRLEEEVLRAIPPG